MQEKWQPDYPLRYALQGYRYCDLLLTDAALAAWLAQLAEPPMQSPEPLDASANRGKRGARAPRPQFSAPPPETLNVEARPFLQERSPKRDVRGEAPRTAGEGARAPLFTLLAEIFQRATRTLGGARQHGNPLDIALDHLTLARVALYREVLGGDPAAEPHFLSAMEHIRAAGNQQHIPRVLLSCAWRRVRRGEGAIARGLLEEAEEISRRGGMKLLLADTLLHRALQRS